MTIVFIVVEYIVESNLLIMSHKEELIQRSTQLQTEIQEIQQSFELKKEEFLKVQGALEMLQILENEKKNNIKK